ncbi:MAG: DNA adenine methylase [Lachnospiraceae bacterium]|nr:DNA adenine methylase [Lachnospiraceae bacterium]
MTAREQTQKLPPLLKYPGGKERELKYILPHLPREGERFFDPFVGGGAVYFSLACNEYFINDKSEELMRLYEMVRSQNEEFLSALTAADHAWTGLEKVLAQHYDKMLNIYRRYKSGIGSSADFKEKAKEEVPGAASEVLFPEDEIGQLMFQGTIGKTNTEFETGEGYFGTTDCRTMTAEELSESIDEFIDSNEEELLALLDERISFSPVIFLEELKRNLRNKLIRMAKLEQKKGDLSPQDLTANLEGALKAGFYMYFRYLYNHTQELSVSEPVATAVWLFVREFCYASMYRYNQNGEFNVPYGGISYNQKSILKKVRYFKDEALLEQLQKTVIGCMDFEGFLNLYEPRENDFVFLDPPYDTEFSTYARNEFGRNAHLRLANYLINHCRGQFMLIIKNTDFIRNLYCHGMDTANGQRIYVTSFAKKYTVSFQERNDKNSEHLLITNYEIT